MGGEAERLHRSQRPSLLDNPGESGSPHTSAITSPLTTCACGRGIPSLAILENPGACRVPESPPNRPSQLGRRQRGERTVAKGKIDPTLSRRWSFVRSHLQPWPAGEPGVTGPGKATAGRQLGWSVSLQSSNGEEHGIGEHRQTRAIVYTSLYLYIRHRHRWAGARGSPRPTSTSAHPHTEAAGVRCGSLGGGGLGRALLLKDTSP